MGRQCLHAESLGRVMAAVENVDSGFFGQGISPTRSFPGEEGIHAFRYGFRQIASRAAGDHADSLANLRSARNYQHLRSGSPLQPLRQVGPRNVRRRLETDVLIMIEEKRTRFFQTERGA